MPKSISPALRWWAQRWLVSVESQAPEFSGRLRRARSYSRGGHVWQLSVQPGRLSAQVLGTYGYYTSIVHVPVIAPEVWERAIKELAERPALLASLLADDLPAELEDLLNAAGGSLFPRSPAALSYNCTCPDWERPCKHALAVCYEFAQRCDARPALLLTLAGRTVDQVMMAVRARWNAAEAVPAVDDAVETLRPLRIEGYYTAGRALDTIRFSFEPPQVNAVLLQLGKPPFSAANEDPLMPLAAFYDEMSGMALRTLQRARQLPSGAPPASERDVAGEDSQVGERGSDP